MRVAIVLTARPSWSKLEPVCRALKTAPDVELQILACASALLPDFGPVVDVVEQQGYTVTERIYSAYAGSTLETSAKETGALLVELSSAFRRLKSDVVVVCADRHEVLAAAQAAAQLHVPLLHLQGGEKTGSIDDKIRDSITHLADVHCVATERAKHRVYGLTGDWTSIYQTGCPSIDVALESRAQPLMTAAELGVAFNLSHPFGVVIQHPVTSEVAAFRTQLDETERATWRVTIPFVWFRSGADAGTVEWHASLKHMAPSLRPNRFLKLMTQAAVLIGNSSAGIRESSVLGTPVVDVGSRQWGRERAKNVLHVPHEADQIRAAIDRQINHGPYASSALYGVGDAGRRIAEVIRCGVKAIP